MNILSHRGYWKTPEERNTGAAFLRSFTEGFGTETDVRDICGKIVISHDMPRGDEHSFEEVLQLMAGRNLPLAINIKADGLIRPLLELLNKYGQTNYFTFDMSIPDMVVQLATGACVFTGQSDLVPHPVLLEESAGIWLDSFRSEWFTPSLVDKIIASGKKVCIVSADLHQRDVREQWTKLRRCTSMKSTNLLLCTNIPNKAREYFL